MQRTAVKRVVFEGVHDAGDALVQASRERSERAVYSAGTVTSSPSAGETALLKHAVVFRSAGRVNKVDLLPHPHFDPEKYLRNPRAVDPGVGHIPTGAATSPGADDWCQRPAEKRGG